MQKQPRRYSVCDAAESHERVGVSLATNRVGFPKVNAAEAAFVGAGRRWVHPAPARR